MHTTRRRFAAGVLAAVSICGSAAGAWAQKPRVLIDTNQMNAYEARNAALLKADGTWFSSYNSPDVDLALWRFACAKIGTGVFATEDGAIAEGYLLDDQFTARVMLRDNAGRYVSAPNGGGQPLVANIPPERRTDNEIFHYFFGPPNTPDPRTPGLSELLSGPTEINLRSYQLRYVQAINGGRNELVPLNDRPSWWERFRIHKLSGGDRTIRQDDSVALQSWGGIFDGGMFVSSVQSRGGTLVAGSPTVGPWETFRVTYPCEYVVAGQIARVTHAMAYTEFSGFPIGGGNYARQWTLTPSTLATIAGRTGAANVTVLTRSFQNVSEYPGKLPTHKQELLSALASPYCNGVVFEMGAGYPISLSEIDAGIDAVCSRNKTCFLLIPPQAHTRDYTADVAKTVKSLKLSRWYGKVNIVLACYGKADTGVTFLGGRNSVEGALKWLLANR